MITTQSRRYAGQITYTVTVFYRVPLPDRAAPGNGGLDGYDEFSAAQRCRTSGSAQSWAEHYRPSIHHGEVTSAVIRSERWDAVTFNDPRYGTVYDAEAIVIGRQEGWPLPDGGWHWDTPNKATAEGGTR